MSEELNNQDMIYSIYKHLMPCWFPIVSEELDSFNYYTGWAPGFLLLKEFFKESLKKVAEISKVPFLSLIFVFFVKSHWKSRWNFKSPLFVTDFRKMWNWKESTGYQGWSEDFLEGDFFLCPVVVVFVKKRKKSTSENYIGFI